MLLKWNPLLTLIALLGVSVSVSGFEVRADEPETLAPKTGFYTLDIRQVYDDSFDPKSIPLLTYWYSEVDPTVPDSKFGLVPAATNRLGEFFKMKIGLRGDRRASETKWVFGRSAQGPAELLIANNGEKLLRLYSEDKNHPLADYALIYLGADQRSTASALRIDSSKFSKTMYLAHRGVARIPLLNKAGVFAGNTLEAMEHALWNGYPGFEIDIQMTKDKVLVVSHDEKLAVSTDCKGMIGEHLLSEIAGCQVKYTGVVPDMKIFHNRALIPGRIPTLKETLDKFLHDPRVQHIVLDVKPGNIDDQTAAFSELLANYPADVADKIIFLMRSTKLIHRLEKGKDLAKPLYAWEGSTGWEALERADKSDDPDEIFQDLDDGNDDRTPLGGDPKADIEPEPPRKSDVALSLSLGLGLGMCGFTHDHKGSRLVAAFQILKSLPKVIGRLFQHHFGNGSVEIDALTWSRRNKHALKRLTEAAAIRGQKIVGWTVNTKAKIGWLRDNSPRIDYILSDLPYRRLMQIQLDELSSAL